jgi:ribosomal protein L18
MCHFPDLKFENIYSQDDLPVQVNENSNNKTVTRNHTVNNEYPTAQIDPKHERELQELFGVEGARKYQEYQLQQQMFGSKDAKADGDVKEAQKKRDNGMGTAEEMQDVSGAMINQMMSRTTRRQREYDVPLIREYFFFLLFEGFQLFSNF